MADGAHPLGALETSVASWKALLQSPALLSEERQAGLFGELLVLRRLVGEINSAALDAWTGPAGQAHDFRLGDTEFEVKTTSGGRRVHLVNGVSQLTPSPGCSLHIVSLMIGHGGTGGQTIAELIDEIRLSLDPFQGAAARFIDTLRGLAYRPEDGARYPRRRRVRAPMALVPVIEGCPRLVPEALAELSSGYATARIGRVNYEIDLTDMGILEGDPVFGRVLPGAASLPGSPS